MILNGQEIILLGADFAYVDGLTHVEGSSHAKTKIQENGTPWVLNSYGEKLATAQNLRGFLRDLESYIALWPHIKFINAGRKGARIEGTTYLETA